MDLLLFDLLNREDRSSEAIADPAIRPMAKALPWPVHLSLMMIV